MGLKNNQKQDLKKTNPYLQEKLYFFEFSINIYKKTYKDIIYKYLGYKDINSIYITKR